MTTPVFQGIGMIYTRSLVMHLPSLHAKVWGALLIGGQSILLVADSPYLSKVGSSMSSSEHPICVVGLPHAASPYSPSSSLHCVSSLARPFGDHQ